METTHPNIGKDIAEKKQITKENETKLRDALQAFSSGWQPQ
jgi:F-type H+-transporting ATPase subunit alpha